MSNFLTMYRDVLNYGQKCSPKGSESLEIENYQITFEPYERMSSFYARNLNINYCKREFEWYLGADRYDQSICEHATMWKKLKDVDGGFNSNYGQYLFKENGNDMTQFRWVISELIRDPQSRRAVMTLLHPGHLRNDNPDVVCTYAMSFRIRKNKLNMSVSMRSNDAIFGTTNDVFCFSMIHEMVFTHLVWSGYHPPGLELGTYTHKVDSLHVYERHYDMLELLVQDGERGYYNVPIPQATMHDYECLEDEWMSCGPTTLAHWMREDTQAPRGDNQ